MHLFNIVHLNISNNINNFNNFNNNINMSDLTTEKKAQGLSIDEYKNLQRPFFKSEISWWAMEGKMRNKALNNKFVPDPGVNIFYPYLEREVLLKRLNEAAPFYSFVPQNFDNKMLATLVIKVEGEYIRHGDAGAAMTDSDKVSNMLKDGAAVTFALKRCCQLHGIGLEEKTITPVTAIFENNIFKLQGKTAKNIEELKAALNNMSISYYYLQLIYSSNVEKFQSDEMIKAIQVLSDNLNAS